MAMNESEIRQHLENELRVTAARLRELGSPVDPRTLEGLVSVEAGPGDSFDRIEATETRERYHFSRERLIERLDAILEALRRLQDGAYGTCSECGQAVGWGRLRAIPEATMCVRCQERLEPLLASQTARGFYGSPRTGRDALDDR